MVNAVTVHFSQKRQALYNHYLGCLKDIADEEQRGAMTNALNMHYMRLQKPSRYYDDMHRHYIRDVRGGANRRMLRMMEDSLSAI